MEVDAILPMLEVHEAYLAQALEAIGKQYDRLRPTSRRRWA